MSVQKEFDRLVAQCEVDKVKLPTKRQMEKKAAQMDRLANQPMTESDIAAMLARKQAMQTAKQSSAHLAMERSRLHQAKTLALRRQDYEEVKQIEAQLSELASAREAQREESSSDILARLNERNRKANMEAVRKAERAELERKRRERSLRAGTATPTSGAAADALARIRAKHMGSRPGTPGTPVPPAEGGEATPRSVSPQSVATAAPAPKSTNGLSFEASLLQSVEIDLGDF